MAAPSSPRRPFAVRYSLRMLLLALTAFAIGFPIWYRWPYEESTDNAGGPSGLDPFASPAGRAPKVSINVVTTWQRQWGGGRVKEGPQFIRWKGKVMRSEVYHEDLLHGPCEYHESSGAKETGQYMNGQKSGEWKSFNPQGKLIQSMTWKDGVLQGLYHQQGDRRWALSGGRLVVDDAAKQDGLAELFDHSQIDNPAILDALNSSSRIEFLETPLQDACDFLQAQHGIPIQTDPFHANGKQPTTGDYRDLDLASLLTILMADHRHACDYRYGSVWITSAEDAKHWLDPTGVAKIEPPANSQLAKSWNEPVSCKASKQPLADLLTVLAQPLAIGVDTSAVQTGDEALGKYVVTREIWGHPFRHALGILLYQTRCRVKLDGETLVILPPAEGH